MFATTDERPCPAALQGSLFSQGEPALPSTVDSPIRIDLGAGAWLDHRPNWLPGADAWFAMLAAELQWQSAKRPMYDRVVAVPRLIWNDHADQSVATPPGLRGLADLLSAHYGRPLPRIGCNWYRHAADSVAMHADRVRSPTDAIVAITSVGARRTLVLRPNHAGPGHRFDLGHGDLLVMGGTTQATWQHGIPKVARAEPRISIMVREAGGG